MYIFLRIHIAGWAEPSCKLAQCLMHRLEPRTNNVLMSRTAETHFRHFCSTPSSARCLEMFRSSSLWPRAQTAKTQVPNCHALCCGIPRAEELTARCSNNNSVLVWFFATSSSLMSQQQFERLPTLPGPCKDCTPNPEHCGGEGGCQAHRTHALLSVELDLDALMISQLGMILPQSWRSDFRPTALSSLLRTRID